MGPSTNVYTYYLILNYFKNIINFNKIEGFSIKEPNAIKKNINQTTIEYREDFRTYNPRLSLSPLRGEKPFGAHISSVGGKSGPPFPP